MRERARSDGEEDRRPGLGGGRAERETHGSGRSPEAVMDETDLVRREAVAFEPREPGGRGSRGSRGSRTGRTAAEGASAP
ncbi:hypothetical protein BM536_032660 [Streptomyces phaeoluteigriseus]|uniref:Uncharacterized protein n=1 Tax=Streptomyces phaeoluteigriseus TaxID=114686 RepID=A0A1V6MK30_9ACTN|nr:hypothetical protein BM536_032660 [Streptomyces phaeoluteigriseus]